MITVNGLEKKFLDSNHTQNNFRKPHIKLVPLSFIVSVVSTIVGVGTQIAVICTAGTNPKIWNFGRRTADLRYLFANPFFHLVKVINPRASFPYKPTSDISSMHSQAIALTQESLKGRNQPTFNSIENGLLASTVDKLKKVAENLSRENGPALVRHVLARSVYLLMILCYVVTRVADGIIGVPAGIVALATMGKVPRLNSLAYMALQAPALVDDLFFCCVKVMNPSAGEDRAKQTPYASGGGDNVENQDQ
jgi:hypothetical protein